MPLIVHKEKWKIFEDSCVALGIRINRNIDNSNTTLQRTETWLLFGGIDRDVHADYNN